MPISLELFSLTVGLIGAITGVISLIWHIHNNKPNLVLKNASFRKEGFGPAGMSESYGAIYLDIILRNLSNRPTTVEKVMITVGNVTEVPNEFEEREVSGYSSKTLTYLIHFNTEDFKELFDKTNSYSIKRINLPV